MVAASSPQSDQQQAITIEHDGHYIVRQYDVYSVDLEKNNLPRFRKELFDFLVHRKQVLIIDGKKWTTRGIELFRIPDDFRHMRAGLMVDPVS